MSEEQIETPEAEAVAPAPPQPGTPEYDSAMAARGAAATGEVPEKFRNPDGTINMDAFTKSYLELEKNFHAPAEPEAAVEAPVEEVPAEPVPEKLQLSEPEPEPEVVAAADAQAGISEEKWGAWKAEIMRDGDVTDASRAELHALGFNDNIIKDFVSAHRSQLRQGMQAAAEVVGGDDRIAKIFAWATNNLDVETRDVVNTGLAGPAWEVTLRGIEAQYDRAQAATPKAQEMSHKPTAANPAGQETTKGYASVAEFSAMRSDPRYGKDGRFTNQVNNRAQKTDWSTIR